MKRVWQFSVGAALLAGIATGTTTMAAEPGPAPASAHDGQHDFDFIIGTGNSRVRRLQNPLTGSTSWIEGDATVSVRKIWNGQGHLEEIEHTTPAGHLVGVTLRLYDPQSRQWRLYWANASQGMLTFPPAIGQFRDGRGEFYDQETFNGKNIPARHRFW